MGRGLHYNIRKDKTYFMTMTVIDWIDLFTCIKQELLIVDSLKYCQEKKGLNSFARCLLQDAARMSSHLLLISNTKLPFDLDHVVRD